MRLEGVGLLRPCVITTPVCEPTPSHSAGSASRVLSRVLPRLSQSFNISVAVAMSLFACVSSGRFPEGSLPEDECNELLGRWLIRDVKASRQLLAKQAGLEFEDF